MGRSTAKAPIRASGFTAACFQFRRLQRIQEQHSDRQRPHAARNRRDIAGHFANRGIIDVAAKPAFDSVHAHINHHRTLPHHIGGDELRSPDCHD